MNLRDRERELREEVKRNKRAMRLHREVCRRAAEELESVRRECQERGIRLIELGEGRSHGHKEDETEGAA